MQKVLITGANGFVGNYLSSVFTSDHQVTATGKGDSRLFFSHPHLQYMPMDFTSETDIQKVFAAVQPDVVIHSGAMSKPDECELDRSAAWLTNVTATQHLLKASAGAFFVFLSTDFIFDGVKGMYKEDDAPSPVNYYGETKLAAEELVKSYQGEWDIVRTILVYGDPRSGRQNILTSVASSLRKDKPVKIVDDQLRTPTYVEDLANAIKTIVDKRMKGVYHISGKDPMTPYEMALAVARYLSLDEGLIGKATAEDFPDAAKRPLKTGFDVTKARIELGYEPMSFADGLDRTFPLRT